MVIDCDILENALEGFSVPILYLSRLFKLREFLSESDIELCVFLWKHSK